MKKKKGIMVTRRDFLKKTVASSLLATCGGSVLSLESCQMKSSDSLKSEDIDITADTAPLWKGFNLLNKFDPNFQTPFAERDFELIAELGFNFVRLPLSYWCWSSENDWFSVDEEILKEIDCAVDYAKQYGLHVNLNFHRVPGYCINNPDPRSNLFEDEEPLKACAFHWKTFAERYKGIANKTVSFNLINEAPAVEAAKYDKVVRTLIKAIRDVDSNRLIIVDGKDVGRIPLMTLADIPNIIQSGRGYDPMLISHFRAGWPGVKQLMEFPKEDLAWPMSVGNETYDIDYLRKSCVIPWKEWIVKGGKVHIGEMGCYNKTPHKVTMAWLEDLFTVFKEQGWGWSLWNLYGDFGILDSDREDVSYENFKGHKLDRKMLELLKRS
ncbi:glycoside hydrolase family 5 protein [Parabacteroides distasonis]|nr:cellulase family glycosylhydrolase [Parabacteroides distasonis]UVR24227.1 cellulase family glycosylhydrolase [Parabacteroides distasonis]